MAIKRAESFIMLSPTRMKRRVKSKIRMAIINRRNSVGTTQKPTSTNKIKMIRKVQRTSTRRREEMASGTSTRRVRVEVQEAKTRKVDLAKKSSKPTRSKTMKTGTSAET